MRILRRYWLLLVVAALTLGGVAWAGLAPVGDEWREEIHVIPKGTWARRSAGEKLDNVPSEIHMMLGVKDILVVRNEDDVPQMFGPVLIMPGQSFRLPFGVATRYDFACTAHVSGQLSVFVEAKPAWWKLLQLRASALATSGNWL